MAGKPAVSRSTGCDSGRCAPLMRVPTRIERGLGARGVLPDAGHCLQARTAYRAHSHASGSIPNGYAALVPVIRHATSSGDLSRGKICPVRVGIGRLLKRNWRRGWDSNPRYPRGYAAFRVRYVRPLCHLSAGHPRCCEQRLRSVEARPLMNCPWGRKRILAPRAPLGAFSLCSAKHTLDW